MKLSVKFLVAAALLFSTFDCSKDGDNSLSSLSDYYVPNFTNGWTVLKGPSGSVFFIYATDVDSSKGTGKIEGAEENGSANYQVKGSFVNVKVKLMYLSSDSVLGGDNGPRAGFSYSGIYDTLSHPYVIRLVNLSNTQDSLVIQHG